MNIIMNSVSKSFDGKPVIKNMSFEIKSGEIICLLGPSGSGKTTTIRLLIGAISADSGTVTFGGTPIPDLGVIRKIGFMPQNDALYDDLSGADNLRFFAGLYGMKKNAVAERLQETLALVGLENEQSKLVKNYSGGMKKRLSLAAALLHEPEVLLLDEPTVGIDPVLRRAIWNSFKALKAAGRTIIVSTHVMDEVTECDRAALIYNGHLLHFDDVSKLLGQTESGKVEELFFAAADNGKVGESA